MKKICVFNGSLARGGSERVTVALADFFAQNHIDCDIVTIGRSRAQEYPVPANVNRICIDENWQFNAFKRIRLFRKYLKSSGCDVLLVMGTPLCLYAIPASRNLKIKTIVSERNAPANFKGKKTTALFSRFLMKQADGFVFQTNEAREFYKGKTFEKSVVIPNPLPVEGLPEPYRGEREKQIVSAGRLHVQKNQKLLISAFAKLSPLFPEYKLTIYGEGGLAQELKQHARDLGVEEKVALPGNVTDLLTRIRKAAVFALPSDFEGMPNVLIEAMATGLPCVSTDCPCGGPRELIEDGKNGYLMPVGDEAALVKILTELLSDEASAARVGENAVLIRERLDITRIAPKWLSFMNNI